MINESAMWSEAWQPGDLLPQMERLIGIATGRLPDAEMLLVPETDFGQETAASKRLELKILGQLRVSLTSRVLSTRFLTGDEVGRFRVRDRLDPGVRLDGQEAARQITPAPEHYVYPPEFSLVTRCSLDPVVDEMQLSLTGRAVARSLNRKLDQLLFQLLDHDDDPTNTPIVATRMTMELLNRSFVEVAKWGIPVGACWIPFRHVGEWLTGSEFWTPPEHPRAFMSGSLGTFRGTELWTTPDDDWLPHPAAESVWILGHASRLGGLSIRDDLSVRCRDDQALVQRIVGLTVMSSRSIQKIKMV